MPSSVSPCGILILGWVLLYWRTQTKSYLYFHPKEFRRIQQWLTTSLFS